MEVVLAWFVYFPVGGTIVFSGALLSSFGLHNYLSSLKVRSKNYSLFISIGIFTVIYIFIGIVTITKNESLGSAIISNFQIKFL